MCSSHGIAFNVKTDLSHYANIIPCGLDNKVHSNTVEGIASSEPLSAEGHKPERRDRREEVSGRC